MHEKLSLVVARPASEDGAFRVDVGLFDDRLEGGCVPQLQWICRLDVVVAVYQYRRGVGADHLLAVHHRIAFGGDDFDVFTARGFQLLRYELGAFLNIARKRRISGNGWNAEQFKQLFEETIAVGFNVRLAGRHGRGFWFNLSRI